MKREQSRFWRFEHRLLITYCITRWNSCQKAIKLATTSPCYEAILAYFEDYADDECRLDELSEDDWDLLFEVNKFLIVFETDNQGFGIVRCHIGQGVAGYGLHSQKIRGGKDSICRPPSPE